MSWSFRLLLWLALLAAARPAARAEPEPGTRLAWVRSSGAEQCPSGPALETDVARRLRRDPFHEPAAQTLEGIARRNDDGTWSAVLYERDASGTLLGSRELTSTGPGCEGLASAVALAVALAIDPDAELAAPAPPPAAPPPARAPEPPVQRPAPLSARVQPPARATADAPRPQHRAAQPAARARLGALLAYRMVPGFAPGVALDVDGHARGPLRWLIGMRYLPEQRANDLGFGLTAARLGACALHVAPRFSAGGCAAAALGALHAVSYQLRPVDPGDRLYAAADLHAELSVTVFEPAFMGLSAGVSLPFVRHRFRVEGRDSAEFQQPPAVPHAVLAAGVHFP